MLDAKDDITESITVDSLTAHNVIQDRHWMFYFWYNIQMVIRREKLCQEYICVFFLNVVMYLYLERPICSIEERDLGLHN